MRGVALFVAGLIVGIAFTKGGWVPLQTAAAQDSSPRALSHVGIAVKDFDASIAYYTDARPPRGLRTEAGQRSASTCRTPRTNQREYAIRPLTIVIVDTMSLICSAGTVR